MTKVGCRGAPPMIDRMLEFCKASAVIVGEPSVMQPVTAQRGVGTGFMLLAMKYILR